MQIDATFLALIRNVSILLAAILLFDLFPARGRLLETLPNRLILGLALGLLVVVVMLTPWTPAPGLVFDTRSVLIGVAGLFFGSLPTLLCMAVATAFRLYQGGQGALTGSLVILSSGLIGILWRKARNEPLHSISWGELLLFGLVVHAAMLLLMFTLAWDTALGVLSSITLPVLLLYPAGTALTGALLAKRLRTSQMREDLAASEALFRSIFEDHAAVKLLIDPETGRIMDANRAAEEFYGWPRERLQAMRIQEINTLPPEEVQREMARARDQKRVHFEFRHCLADGSIRNVEVLSGLIRHKGRKLLHSIIYDISNRKRMEQELVRAKEGAEAASRAKSEFLAIMSHEIRTPLSGVMGMLQILQEAPDRRTRDEWVEAALGASRHLNQILCDVLDLSSIEAGRMRLRRVPFTLDQAVTPVLGALAATARNKNLGFTAEIAPELARPVLGDPGRLRQIIFNLAGNALKYSERGEVCIRIYSLPAAPAGADVAVHVAVHDTGIGIPDARLKDIFEPFTQVENPLTRKQGGTGLGLNIVKRLVALMQGSLAVCSEPGKGTEVHITLPLALAGTMPKPLARGEVPAALPKGLRLLLVEDERVNRLAMSRMLEKEGHRVIQARNGVETLAALKAEDVDAVLMDIQMPDMDGVEVTRIIRSDAGLGRNVRVPIVALTAHAMPGDRERFLAAGMDGYLSKPVDMAELRRELGRALAEWT